MGRLIYGSIKEDKGGSVIGYAWSRDGIFWERLEEPVVVPDCTWEKRSLMCPTILWDQKKEIYKLWYCGGGWFEPDAIGYAESKDGIVWENVERTRYLHRIRRTFGKGPMWLVVR